MVLAGSLAHQGYFSYKWVAVTAFMGGFFGDQFYFWLGRYYGNRVFDRFPRIGVHAGKARDLLNRYNTLFILTNRFMYGVRIVGPIVVGTTNISSRKFLWLNMIRKILARPPRARGQCGAGCDRNIGTGRGCPPCPPAANSLDATITPCMAIRAFPSVLRNLPMPGGRVPPWA